jgi:hypothetical protein
MGASIILQRWALQTTRDDHIQAQVAGVAETGRAVA